MRNSIVLYELLAIVLSGYGAYTRQRLFYTLSTYLPYITAWFHCVFFSVYIGGVTSQQEEIGQGVKPLFSHQNFVQILLPIRKKYI